LRCGAQGSTRQSPRLSRHGAPHGVTGACVLDGPAGAGDAGSDA
jgi:hypothetical protein